MGFHQGLGSLGPAGHLRQLPLELRDLAIARVDRGRLAAPLLRGQPRQLAARPGRVGVWLEPNEGPETIAADLARLPLVAVEFPKFTDGRGFSTASLLRSRYGYRGEIRAIGDVLRDQLLYLRRCGFDAFALREDQDAEAALGAFDDLPPGYQSAVDEPLPLFRRRLAGAPA